MTTNNPEFDEINYRKDHTKDRKDCNDTSKAKGA